VAQAGVVPGGTRLVTQFDHAVVQRHKLLCNRSSSHNQQWLEDKTMGWGGAAVGRGCACRCPNSR
jgi:hypothetical protein